MKLIAQLPIRPVGACLALFLLLLLGPATAVAQDNSGPEPVLPALEGEIPAPPNAAGEGLGRAAKPAILLPTAEPFPDYFLLPNPGPDAPQFLPAPFLEPQPQGADEVQELADLPDLIVEDIWSTTNPLQTGQEENIIFRIKNQGSVDITTSFKVRLKINGVVQGTWLVTDLAAGSTTEGSTKVVVNTGGNQPVEVFVDFEDKVAESDEDNNIIIENWYWATSLVDLTVLDLWTTTTPILIGQKIDVFFRIKNQGSMATPLSFDTRLWVDGQVMGTWTFATLAAGAQITGVFNDLQINKTGVHEIKITVDYTDLVPEYDEGNNTRTENWTWKVGPLDLIVEDVWSNTEPLVAGDQETLKLRIKNLGYEATAEKILTRVWVDGVVAGTIQTNGLGAGATANGTLFITVDDPGPHEVKVVVDHNNAVQEVNENNNERIETWTWGNPPIDLIVVDFWPDTEPLVIGETETVKLQIKNQGTQGTAETIHTRLWVDGVIVGTAQTSGLAPGATAVESLDIQVADPGLHELKVVVDHGNIIPEEDEDNNERTESWTWENPPVDLFVDELWSTTDPLVMGQPANISYRIKNLGTADITAGFSTQIWVDSTLVDTVSEGGLAAGATAVGTAEIQIDTLGTHEVRVVVDYDDLIPETDETNNEATATWNWVAPQVDLIVELIWSESAPLHTGEMENLSFRLRNTSADAIGGSFVTQVWLDSTLVDTITTKGLAAGEKFDGSTSVKVDDAGEHLITVLVDADNEIEETNENNNKREETLMWVEPIQLIFLPTILR